MNPASGTPSGSRTREIFLGALERSAPADREAFLDQACEGNSRLRARVEELLAEDSRAGGFLESPAFHPADRDPAGDPASVFEKPGDAIGRYRLVSRLGEGGCGVVYLAEQSEPVRRTVALKVIKLGMDTRSVIARFEAERQALALMDHPNIARVFDAGATQSGRPFFVMERVEGLRVTDHCDEVTLPIEDRLRLFLQVCHAIQHAHQKGIIHRDIKPSNILVTPQDGSPAGGCPKVIDFGIAKATEQRLSEQTYFTEIRSFLGTPAYMSPEQAGLRPLDVDTRSDVYSLGVLLYELLTGHIPFDADRLREAGLEECCRLVRETEPPRPSARLAALPPEVARNLAARRRTRPETLIRQLRGDLDWIVMCCLEKEPTRRYATVNGLAADLQRFLNNEPVAARPPSALYRTRKLLRRHRGTVAAAAAIAAALVLGSGLSFWQAIRATRAEQFAVATQKLESIMRRKAEREGQLARLNEYVADMNLAHQSLSAGNLGRAVQLLEKHRPRDGRSDLRGFEWRYLWRLCQGDEHVAWPLQDASVRALALSPGRRFLAAGLGKSVRVFDPASRRLVTRLDAESLSLLFTPDSRFLITAGPRLVQVWNTADWTLRRDFEEGAAPVALSPDGIHLALATRGGIAVVELEAPDWRGRQVLPRALGPLAFSPDGTALATDSPEGVTLWPLGRVGSPIRLRDSTGLFGGWMQSARALVFTPDGRTVVAPRNSLSAHGVFVLCTWDTRTGEETGCFPDETTRLEHTGMIAGLALSPDGRTLATASWDHSVRLWDLPTGRHRHTLQGHQNEVWSLDFSPDGHSLATGSKDGGLHLWPIPPRQREDTMTGGWVPLSFSADGRRLATSQDGGSVAFVDPTHLRPDEILRLDGPPSPFGPSLVLNADLSRLAQGRREGGVQVWDTGRRQVVLSLPDLGRVDSVALSPDGQDLITGNRDQVMHWWDLRQGATQPALTLTADHALFSADGTTLATLGRGVAPEIWNVPRRTRRATIGKDAATGWRTALSPDGRILATVTDPNALENAIHLWDTTTGRLIGSCRGHKQGQWAIAFSPDGKTLASSSDDGTLRLWNVATQQELLSFRRLGTVQTSLLFSPDGRCLVGVQRGRGMIDELRFIRAATLTETEGPSPDSDSDPPDPAGP